MPDDHPDQPEVTGPARTSRRRVVAGGAALAGGVLAPLALLGRPAGAASSTTTTAPTGPTTTVFQPPRAIRDVPGELELVTRARALGYALVGGYDAVLDDPEGIDADLVVTLASFRVGHLDAANSWSAVAGLPSDTTPDPDLEVRLTIAAVQARTPEARLVMLHDAEQLMADEMMTLLGQVQSLEAARASAGIVSSCVRRGVVLAMAAGVDLETAIPTFQPLEAEAP